MLAVRDEDQLIQGLRDMIRAENEIESEKTVIANKHDFNLQDAFKIFDQRGYGVVDRYELTAGLNAIGLFPTSDEVDLWIKRYDSSGDGRITSREFE